MFWLGVGVGIFVGLLLVAAAIMLLASVDPLPDRKDPLLG